MHSMLTANRQQVTKNPMKTHTRIGILSAAALSLLGVGFAATASAHSSADDTGFAERIATKFNLNQEEVQTFLKEERATHEAEREAKHAQRLAELVTDGKLTQAQADALTAKHAEMKANRETEMESMKDLTHEERRAKMEEKRTEMDAWLKEQGIDPEVLRPSGEDRGGKGFGHGPR